MSENWDIQRIARATLILAVVLVSVWMLRRFLPALAWAGVLAIATWPLRQRLARHGLSKSALAALLTLLLALVLVLPLIRLGIQAAHESGAVMKWTADVRQNGLGTPQWLAHLPLVGNSLAAWWQANLAAPGAARALLGRAGSTGVLTLTRTVGAELANRVTILVFTLLALFFLYRDGVRMIEQARVIADRLFGPAGAKLGKDAIAAVRGTVNGLVLVGLGEGVLLAIAYVATGLSHAALLGLLTAVLATVPFGAPLVFIACALSPPRRPRSSSITSATPAIARSACSAVSSRSGR
ncbi:MAG: AI-2E family transporter [Xanthobacteraceae bacterium]